jgi:hypothetical protein
MGMYLVNDGTAAPDFETESAHFGESWDFDALPIPEADGPVETMLDSADELALEAGIASVFDSLRSSDAAYAPPQDEAGEVEPTLALLDELNRLWAQPLAA